MLPMLFEDRPLLDPLPTAAVTVVIRNEDDDNHNDLIASEVSNPAYDDEDLGSVDGGDGNDGDGPADSQLNNHDSDDSMDYEDEEDDEAEIFR